METQKHIDAYQELFDYMYDTYGVILLKSEMDYLIKVCNKTVENYNDASEGEKIKPKNLGLLSGVNWVAINERLPEESWGDYMICLENNAVFKANYSRIGNERWLIVGMGDIQNTNPIKYWAELPKPPCL